MSKTKANMPWNDKMSLIIFYSASASLSSSSGSRVVEKTPKKPPKFALQVIIAMKTGKNRFGTISSINLGQITKMNPVPNDMIIYPHRYNQKKGMVYRRRLPLNVSIEPINMVRRLPLCIT